MKGINNMLRINQKALKVLIDNEYQYVFCHRDGKIITTKDKQSAIIGDYHSLNYFQERFANNEFIIEK